MKNYAISTLVGIAFGLTVVGIVLSPGCSWWSSTKPTLVTAGNTAVDCAKVDLGVIVTGTALTLLGDVATILEGGSVDWMAQLDKLEKTLGADAVACAVKAVDTVATAPSSSAKMSDLSPAHDRAIQYLTTKHITFVMHTASIDYLNPEPATACVAGWIPSGPHWRCATPMVRR